MNAKVFSVRKIVTIAIVIAVVIAVFAMLRSQQAGPGKDDFVEYKMSVASDIPTAVAAGPDGAVWVTLDFADAMGLIRDGKLERISKGRKSVEPVGLAVDANGAAWFTDPTAVLISRIVPGGEIKSFPLGTPIARLGRLAVAPDGAVWFAESTALGFTRLKDGQLTRHEVKSLRGGPYGVAVDAKGIVWGTLQQGNQLVRIAPGKEMEEFELPTSGSAPSDVAVDSSGNVWVVEFRANKIAKFSEGKFSEITIPGEWSSLTGIAAASDGSVWFGMLRAHALGRIRDGQFKLFELPRKDARPYTIAIDKSDNVWY
ncbi:MAG: hypothetical protein ABI771_03280, partial [Betaproteobacteria bacterium]